MNRIRFLLFPFAALYYLITWFRNFLFDTRILKATSFSIPTIVVGNLSVGGTGKTPQIEYLIRLLNGTYKVAVLSRGYKRKTKGFLEVDKNITATEVGDEPLQFYKKFKNIHVAVDENRVHGIWQLINIHKPNVVLLDDAFQHRKLQGSFYVLLTSYNDLFVDDFLLPAGNLRESRHGAKRGNIIIVTKCPENLSETEQQKIIQKMNPVKNQLVFFTKISYSEKVKGFLNIDLQDCVDFEILLITGIANPIPLLEFLSKKNISYQHLKFSDHHHFSAADIRKITAEFEDMQSDKKMILTTEKDFVRLSQQLKNISYLEIETTFLSRQEALFDQSIIAHIHSYNKPI